MTGGGRPWSATEDDVSIWLHALYHGGHGWAFRSGLPRWVAGASVATAEAAVSRLLADHYSKRAEMTATAWPGVQND